VSKFTAISRKRPGKPVGSYGEMIRQWALCRARLVHYDLLSVRKFAQVHQRNRIPLRNRSSCLLETFAFGCRARYLFERTPKHGPIVLYVFAQLLSPRKFTVRLLALNDTAPRLCVCDTNFKNPEDMSLEQAVKKL